MKAPHHVPLLLFLTLSVSAVPGWSAPPNDEDAQDPAALEHINRLDHEVGTLFQQLGDWSQQHAVITDMVENMWKQNGWNDEADLWAKQAALEVAEIPPWKMQERLQAVSEKVRRRYGMDDQQVVQMQSLMYREMFGMTVKYAPLMLTQAKDLLDARARGEPFTAEQIANMEKAWDPFLNEILNDVGRMTTDFGAMLEPQQKEIYQRDLKSFHKRMDYFLEARERWKEGGWTPQEWGLQNDPIHRFNNEAPVAQRMPVDSMAMPYDETSWEKYVKAFIQLYDLDPAQQNACTSILEDMVSRAKQYRMTQGARLSVVPAGQWASHRLTEPIRHMFEELKRRLEAIPTDTQIRQAQEHTRSKP